MYMRDVFCILHFFGRGGKNFRFVWISFFFFHIIWFLCGPFGLYIGSMIFAGMDPGTLLIIQSRQ